MSQRYKRRNANPEKSGYKTKLMHQIVICVVIFSTVFVIGLLKTQTATHVCDRIKNSISYTVDYQTTVKNIVSDIKNLAGGIKDGKTTTD